MSTVTVHPDLELWLTTYVRDTLAARPEPFAAGVQVAAVEPGPLADPPERLVTLRIDGGRRLSWVTDVVDVGVNVYAGTKQLPKEANDLTSLVRAILQSAPGRGDDNPLAAVIEATRPYRVTEDSDRARLYFTISFAAYSATAL